ncbi:hypothetical protein C6341_g19647 [Phytophthora cactorum]|nr:hypothetical protein C6341_g19647 [Phytophthora cactorum]KAG4046025.1 hypothetical protein PC123_g18578 [Phytophthora cactorum]
MAKVDNTRNDYLQQAEELAHFAHVGAGAGEAQESGQESRRCRGRATH